MFSSLINNNSHSRNKFDTLWEVWTFQPSLKAISRLCLRIFIWVRVELLCVNCLIRMLLGLDSGSINELVVTDNVSHSGRERETGGSAASLVQTDLSLSTA